MTALFPYQCAGAAFLASRRRALLADDMGLGKSAQAIVACEAVGARTILVVCPASLRQNWAREFGRFWFGSRAPQVHVLSYDLAARAKEEMGVDVLILDEAHYLKTKTAKRTKAIYGPKCDGVGGLVERAKHVFLLTGTPSPNNVSELWTHLRAVFPEAILGKNGKPMTYWQFVDKFCITVDNGFGIQIKGGKNLPDLKARIKPFVLRRKKEEVLADLPPIRFDTMPLDADLGALREAEANLPPGIAEALEKDGVAGLQAIAGHVATWRRLVGQVKVKPLAERILEELEGGLQKLVVFAHHRDVIDALDAILMRELSVPGARPVCCLTGNTPPDARQLLVDHFQKTKAARVFLGQIQAAGTGLTLTAASDLIFAETSWVPAENEQAAMRIHRIGQKNACLVRFATLPGSIDELIMKAVERKMKDIKEMFG